MAQNDNFTDLQELREQYKLLEEKVEKQDTINDGLIRTVMSEKMSWIDSWYKNDFIASIALIPISIAFIVLHFPWQYILYVDLVGVLYFVLNLKAHRTLKEDNIFSRSMSEASECIIKHKKLRIRNHMIVAIPAAIMVIWTIYIGGGQTWNLPSMLSTGLLLACAIIGGLIGERRKMKQLDEVLQQIAKMR